MRDLVEITLENIQEAQKEGKPFVQVSGIELIHIGDFALPENNLSKIVTDDIIKKSLQAEFSKDHSHLPKDATAYMKGIDYSDLDGTEPTPLTYYSHFVFYKR